MKRLFDCLSIRGKLTAVVMVACFASLLTAGAFQGAFVHQQARANLVVDLNHAATNVGRNAASAVLFGDEAFATEALSGFKADDKIILASIFDADGQPFASYTRAGTRAQTPPTGPAGHEFAAGYVDVRLPIDLEGDRVGSILVRSDRSPIRARMFQYARALGLVVLIAGAIAFAVSSVLQRFLTAPILALSKMARTIQHEEDFSLRATRRPRNGSRMIASTHANVVRGCRRSSTTNPIPPVK